VSKPSEIFGHFLILSCLKSKLGVFNGWFNGDFAKCMARKRKQSLDRYPAIYAEEYLFLDLFLAFRRASRRGYCWGRSDRLSDIFQPFITAVNSIPRIALAPIIVPGVRDR